LLAGGTPVDWLLAIFLTPLAYSALLNCTCVALSGHKPDRRINPILNSMAIPASTFLKELVSSFLDFFSLLFVVRLRFCLLRPDV
jgi:hypothetical protein